MNMSIEFKFIQGDTHRFLYQIFFLSSFFVDLVNLYEHIRRHNRIKTPLMVVTQVYVHLSSSFDNLHVQRRNNLHSDRKGARKRERMCVCVYILKCLIAFSPFSK